MTTERDMRGAAAVDPPCDAPTATAGTPLYVHLPYCAAKCHYCDFFSVPAEGHDIDGTLTQILREAELRAPRAPRTVYLGGGTPSLLSCAQLERVLDRLHELTNFRASAVEVTAECNPESLDLERAQALLALGVTRLSIGFQSLDQALLELFGRVHSVDDSFRAYEAARCAGARDVNVDLIYAAPGQSLERWCADLARVAALRPDHVSAYNLTFEEETPFRRWLDQGRLARTPEELELELFAATRSLLGDAGLQAYEISNFARPGHECRHNVNYWHNGEYVGLGPSAVSKVGRVRAGNMRSIHEYGRRVQTGGHALAWSEELAPRARLGETWWLGLRLREGLSASEARARAGVSVLELGGSDPTDSIVAHLVECGLLARSGESVHLTSAGLPLADAVAREFLVLADEPKFATACDRGVADAK